MTKSLIYEGAFKQSLLMDELLTAFPEWLHDESNDLYLEGSPNGSIVYLTVPEDADKKRIDKLIKAHDKSKLSKSEKIEQKRLANRASAETKLVALGLTRDEAKTL